MFTASPPRIRPTLAVVSASTRPSCIRVMARAAMRTALIPASGSIPAWADFPSIVTRIFSP